MSSSSLSFAIFVIKNMDLKFDLEGYSKVEEVDGFMVYSWYEEGTERLHRLMDKPARLYVQNTKITSAEWFERGVRHRSLGKPAVVSPGVSTYFIDGRQYHPEVEDELYGLMDEVKFGETPLTPDIRRDIMNVILQRYFYNYGIEGSLVNDYASGRLKVIHDGCYSILANPLEDSLLEPLSDKSPTSNLCLKISDEGITSEITRVEFPVPNTYYRYVAYLLPPDSGLTRLQFEFMEPEFMNLRSTENHLVLMNIHPPHGNKYRYLFSGEMMIRKNKLEFNFNSPMFREFHIKGAREKFEENIMINMKLDMIYGKLDKAFIGDRFKDNTQNYIDYAYLLVHSIIGSNLWKSLMEAIIWETLDLEPGEFKEDGFTVLDKKSPVMKRHDIQDKWCRNGLSLKLMDDKGNSTDLCGAGSPVVIDNTVIDSTYRYYEQLPISKLLDYMKSQHPHVKLSPEDRKSKSRLVKIILRLEK